MIDDGNFDGGPSSPWIPLTHSLNSQSQGTPPTITAHPYRPTAKPDIVPHQVRKTLSHLTPFLLSLSYHFNYDVFMITLVYFQPLGFLLLTFHFIFLTHLV